jgi:hypothetical protein
MGLTGALKEISVKKCPHCKKEYGRHSKKQFMKCLYTANYNLYHLIQEYNKVTKADESPKEEVKGEEIAEKVS